ncbi:MAG TPA: FecR family protein [Kofleriaceae bacterium]|nr:FecR family protein [Kofleriaceae bacterium]
MSAHVAPHRWADLWAGKVADAERAEMERHAERCRTCARVRQRVTRASDSFAQIRTLPSPDVSWDAVRARVHWSVSTERRAALRRRPPAYAWLAGALVGGIAVGLVTGPLSKRPAEPQIAFPAPPERGGPSAPPPAELVGLVSRAAGDVMVDGVRPADLFARKLARGNRIATGDGHVDVQFGEGSGFALGANSTLELRRFDAQTIEIAIDGTLDLAVAPRATGQRFLVDAGDQVVEVRGTQFRVTHDDRDGSTSVACRHGLVSVSDRSGKVEVGDARRVHIAQGRPLSSEQVAPLDSDDLSNLTRATPHVLPLWDPVALFQSSAPLEIATSGRRDVRVDGLELGLAPLKVRVRPGRHTVEAADSAGRFRRAGWVDVTATPSGARLEVPAEPPPTGGIGERRRQLHARIDQPQLASCMRSIAKAGMTGTYVQIEIAVDAQGAVGFLNVIDTDLPSATASCVREVLADVRFGPGPAASWHERIDL